MTRYFHLLLSLAFFISDLPAQPPTRVRPFNILAATLLDGPFKHATELNARSLLQYDADRLLARFRSEAGLTPKAEPYKGWEGESLAGHSLGHHLSGCAMMYQALADKRFLDRVSYIVGELAACQAANGDGYVGAIPNGARIMEEEVAKGNIRSQGFDLNGMWSPFYVHHKVMAGLRDAYRLCGNSQALEVEKAFADWIGAIFANLTEEQIQNVLNCEFGGIQETIADLYHDTKEEKYLRLARLFHHESVIDPLAEGRDILPGKHGNTQIPKLIASADLYELTGDEKERRAAEFFWERVVDHHSYVTGGHGNHEYFGEPDKLRNRLSEETTETCNVYNMLKLSQHLFSWHPDAKIADYCERALLNHILAAQHPETGRVIYNLSLEMGGTKTYQDPEWFTCCVGTAMETHSKYGGSIYYRNDEALYVSQYIASELVWKEKGLVLTQETSYPEEQGTSFKFTLLGPPAAFSFCVRYPFWATRGMEVKVNGKKQKITRQPGSYIAINRTWKTGDRVVLKFPFSLRLEPMPDDSNRVAVCYGPLVLAGDLGPADDPKAKEQDYVPVFLPKDRDPQSWLIPVPGKPNTFGTKNAGRPRDVAFKPFYQTHDRRYSVYFDLFTEESWRAHQEAYQAELLRRKKLEEITYDAFQPGEMQPERDHNFTGERTTVLENFKGRKAREADRGGWFSFDMKVQRGRSMALVFDYWGGFTGSKTFDILVNGVKIATENISGKKDGEFIDVQYDIPAELTRDVDVVTVKIAPQLGHRGGPVFFARTIRREE